MKKTTAIKLVKPVIRGETKIKEVTIIEPTVATLKGLTLLDVMQANTTALATLLPRITVPNLTKAEVHSLNVKDFTALSLETIAFFMPADEEETETDEEMETTPLMLEAKTTTEITLPDAEFPAELTTSEVTTTAM